MNKFGFLISLLILGFSIQAINLEEIDLDMIYDKIVILAKGLSQNGEEKCSANLVKNKEKLMNIIQLVIADLNKGDELPAIIARYTLKILAVPGFVGECKVFDLVAKVMALKEEKGIKDIGYNLINNSAAIVAYIEEFKNAADLDAKLVVIGKIIKVVTDLEVL